MDEQHTYKGRGATRNPKPRFADKTIKPVDDGWSVTSVLQDEFIAQSPKTRLYRDKTRNILSTNSSPDIPFDQSINPYKGCEHGCVYCYARPTHSYLDLSPGLDFETKIFYKTNTEQLLRKTLDNPKYNCQPIALGTNTDPYQPAERELRITRTILEILLEYRHPVSIVTKGVLILRDLDLLQEFAEQDLLSVGISITTLNNSLKTKMEPRAASPNARLKLISALSNVGVSTGVMVAPIIPVLTDQELEDIVEKSVEVGAEFAGYVMIRLPLEVEELFQAWLDEHYPLKAERIMNRIRDMHGGKAYDSRWGERMRGSGMYAELIRKRFELVKRKCDLLDTDGSVSGTRDSTSGPFQNTNLIVNGKRIRSLRTDLFRRRYEQTQLFD